MLLRIAHRRREDVTALGGETPRLAIRVVEFMADIIRFLVADLAEKQAFAYESRRCLLPRKNLTTMLSWPINLGRFELGASGRTDEERSQSCDFALKAANQARFLGTVLGDLVVLWVGILNVQSHVDRDFGR